MPECRRQRRRSLRGRGDIGTRGVRLGFDEELPHVLFAAFAEVPGPTAIGARLVQLIGAFSDEFDVDGMTLKGRELAHIQRLGTARMLRVPVEGKTFHERLGSYTRALGRQLTGDVYQLVYCADVFSAQIASAYRESAGFTLIVEVNDLPSESFDLRYAVSDSQGEGKPPPDLAKLRSKWREMEKQALRAADVVVAPSRQAARALSARVDARRLLLMPRAIDRTVFAPPSVEVTVDRRPTVLVVGARDDAGERASAIAILQRLVAHLPLEVGLVLAAQGQPDSEELERALEGTGLDGRVRRIDIDGPVRLANALLDADVVVIPGRPEAGATPLAIPHRVLEAFACRRPVLLAGAASPLKGMLEDDNHLVVVDPGDAERVAQTVVALLADPDRRARLAAAGLRYIGDHADLEARVVEFAQLISERLGVRMRPRGPEHTERAPSQELASDEDSSLDLSSEEASEEDSEEDSEDRPPASEADLPMVSAVEVDGGAGAPFDPHRTLMPEVPRPVSMERFTAERALSAVGPRGRDPGSDPWGDDTQVEAATPAPMTPRPELDDVPPEHALEAQPTSTFQPVFTLEQRSLDRTEAGDSEVARLVEAERAAASPAPSTAVASRVDVETESAQYESLAARFTDPGLRAPRSAALEISPSALDSLADVSGDEDDEWAPDTVFDASPVFSAEQPPGRPSPAASAEATGPSPRAAAVSTGVRSDDDSLHDTRRNPASVPRTETSSRLPRGTSHAKSLLVDVEREGASSEAPDAALDAESRTREREPSSESHPRRRP